MEISICGISTNACGRELKPHGSREFPAAVYEDDLKLNPVDWHWHDEMEIGVITRGKVCISADRATYTLEEGDGFYICPGVLHKAVPATTGEQADLRSIVFETAIISGEQDGIYYEKYLKPMLNPTALPFVLLLPAKERENMTIQLIRKAWDICVRGEYGYEILTRNCLSELILQLCILTSESTKKANNLQTDTLRKSTRMKEMLTYIDFHYHEELALKDIAGAAHISESEALREFHMFMKQSPIRFLNEYRIRKAAEYLTGTKLPIREICGLCGFGDVSYFTKIFRCSTGLPPGKYRAGQSAGRNGSPAQAKTLICYDSSQK